jgi:hypothetical protein
MKTPSVTTQGGRYFPTDRIREGVDFGSTAPRPVQKPVEQDSHITRATPEGAIMADEPSAKSPPRRAARRLFPGTLLLVAAYALLTGAASAGEASLWGRIASVFSADMTVVHVADLPPWSGDTTTLAWLNPSDVNSTAVGPWPDVRMGVRRQNQLLYPYMMNEPGESLPLIGGWSIAMENSHECLSINYSLEHPQKERQPLEVKHRREDIWLSRALSCIGGTATIYYTVVLNDRYLAFMTSEPGLRFFDVTNGVVLPLIVLDNTNHYTNLYASPAGEVLVEIQVDVDGKTNATSIDRQADGVRRVVFNGAPLAGGAVPNVAEELTRLNQARTTQRREAWQ